MKELASSPLPILSKQNFKGYYSSPWKSSKTEGTFGGGKFYSKKRESQKTMERQKGNKNMVE